MTKRSLAILVVLVVVVGIVAVAVASSIGGSNDEPTHTMPGGEVMDGGVMQETTTTDGSGMDDGSMDGMDDGSMDGMDDGSMDGMDMGN